jgi:hypothetical protein
VAIRLLLQSAQASIGRLRHAVKPPEARQSPRAERRQLAVSGRELADGRSALSIAITSFMRFGHLGEMRMADAIWPSLPVLPAATRNDRQDWAIQDRSATFQRMSA